MYTKLLERAPTPIHCLKYYDLQVISAQNIRSHLTLKFAENYFRRGGATVISPTKPIEDMAFEYEVKIINHIPGI